MQDPITQGEQDPHRNNGELYAPTVPLSFEPTEPSLSTKTPQDASQATGTPAPLQQSERSRLLPQKVLSHAVIAGVIAGVLAALLTIVITLVNAGTFYAAKQQIAIDRLTVKTALALVAWELLSFVLSLLIGFVVGVIVGRIAIRRRFGFLAGALAGAVFSLLLTLVSLFPSYPGNIAGNGTTTGSLVISLLFLCLWSIGGGLVSLFGAWIATVRHPYYQSR